MKNARMLYRPGTELRVWDQFDVDTLIVDESEVETHLADGWFLRPDEMPNAPEEKGGEGAKAGSAGPDLLDNPASVVIPALEGKSLAELEALSDAERGGKIRKGVMAALDAAIEQRLAD